VAVLAACEHLRDRFLLSLLAETGMRVGQSLGLRHAGKACEWSGRPHKAGRTPASAGEALCSL
jgi:integrase